LMNNETLTNSYEGVVGFSNVSQEHKR
jgi:hypothetical protein